MTEFFKVLPPDQALATLLQHLPDVFPTSSLDTADALGLTTTHSILSPSDLPAFPRSTMDGYAVRAKDTFGSSQTLPAYLTLVGEIPMGTHPHIDLDVGQTALVHTGGMIPLTANAIVMVENTQSTHENEIEVLKAVAVGENLLKVGEDVLRDAEVLPARHRIRPQDIGALMALGITTINVIPTPRVGIISTGDEVVPPTSGVSPGQVRDINSYTVGALVQKAGAIPKSYGIVHDNVDAVLQVATTAIAECDAVVITAGSSVSHRDTTAEVIGHLGAPGVLVHGVAVKPGKPTIMAVSQGKPVFGLPGNPVSALVTADLFLVPTIYHLQGTELPEPCLVQALTTHNIASSAGREDYVPGCFVRTPHSHETADIEGSKNRWVSPVFGKSNLIFTLVRAHGAIMVPLNSNGIARGQIVDVKLF